MDTEKTNYPEHLEDIEPDDYILDDTLSSWNREKRPIWKRLVTGSEAPFVLMGIGLIVVITLFFLFAPKGESGDTHEKIVQLSGRVQQLEEKIATYDALLQRLPSLEKEIESIQKMTHRLESMDASAALRIDRVVKDVKLLKDDFKSSKIKASPSTSKSALRAPIKSTPIQKSKQVQKQATVVAKKSAPKQVDAIYHEVKKGETLYRISRQHNVSVETINRLNGLKKGTAIYPGQKLVIKPPAVE